MIGKVPDIGGKSDEGRSKLRSILEFCGEAIGQIFVVAIFFGCLYYAYPKAYAKLSFWANTPTLPTIKSCKITEIKDTEIPNEISAKATVSLDNNFSDSQQVIAVSKGSNIEIADYYSGMASKLSGNVYNVSLKDGQSELAFGLRIYKADLVISEQSLSESDCFVQLHFIER